MAVVRFLISNVSRMFYLRKGAERARVGKNRRPVSHTRYTSARYGENGEQIRGDRHETYLKMFYLKGKKVAVRTRREEHLRNESRPGIIRPPTSSSMIGEWSMKERRQRRESLDIAYRRNKCNLGTRAAEKGLSPGEISSWSFVYRISFDAIQRQIRLKIRKRALSLCMYFIKVTKK